MKSWAGTSHRPNSSSFSPELDVTEELGEELTNRYQQLIGVLRWSIELRRIDILTEVSCLYQHLCYTREGSCSSPRWDNLPSGHQQNPLLGLILWYMYWGQKYFYERIETYQYMQKKEVNVLMGFLFVFRGL